MYTEKYKLKVKVMQFFFRLGCVQQKFKVNRDYTKQKNDILSTVFEKYHQTEIAKATKQKKAKLENKLRSINQ